MIIGGDTLLAAAALARSLECARQQISSRAGCRRERDKIIRANGRMIKPETPFELALINHWDLHPPESGPPPLRAGRLAARAAGAARRHH